MLSKQPGLVVLAHELEKLGKIIRGTKDYLGYIVDTLHCRNFQNYFGHNKEHLKNQKYHLFRKMTLKNDIEGHIHLLNTVISHKTLVPKAMLHLLQKISKEQK